MNQAFVILVMIDIVDSTKTTEKLGDMKMSQKMRLYDRISRGLLIKWNGLEIDRTDGYLLVFENMREALEYSMEYHKLVELHLGFSSRIGIHAGVVVMHSNDSFFVSRGAKPIEIEGIQKSVCARIMNLSLGGQTLLSQRAGQIAMSVRGKLLMKDVGKWKFKGLKKPMLIYAISWSLDRLKRPKGNDKAKLLVAPKLTKKELFKLRLKRYGIPSLVLFYIYCILIYFYFLEFAGETEVPAKRLLKEIHNFDLFETFFAIKKSLLEFLKTL